MQWLLYAAVDVLDRAIARLDEGGFTTSRVEAVCALVLGCDPSDPEFLEDIRSYKALSRRTRPRQRLRGVPLVLRVPSPITFRLDGLVKAVSKIDRRVYRHEVVGALLLGLEGPDLLETRCREYEEATAADAAVIGQLRREVLSQQKPRQGARL